ncbi:hypothetical protein CY34DRAFT_17878 [Suillus luteus UH-Slu-Lm8-n1]|uniref:Uncharacterized protein n=1 Tax=Suillus luteus UH-Slu-Lm8-n1 TaxID=930992 RepID=A0A0D0A7U1_9AGAM|nr:hypothetical protein CY34DRAFT_17878 [Suillus luteus UH-Slu-Lm8-n1]
MDPRRPGIARLLICSSKKYKKGALTENGILETPVEVEQRLIMKRDKKLKATHQMTCWRNKYCRRVAVVDNLVKQTADENEDDLPAWRWLQQLVKTLGESGMSSEESDVENDIETVLRVKNMRLVDNDIFTPQGSKPMKQIHAAGNMMTSWAEVSGLPKAVKVVLSG